MDFKKLTLTALISSLLVSSVWANQQKEEEEDSVTEWGPWALAVPTAAGPEVAVNPLLFAGGAGPEHVFFDPDLPTETGCLPGAPCGYASYYPFSYDYSENDDVSIQQQGLRGDFFARHGISSLTPVSAGFFMEELAIDGPEGLRKKPRRGPLQFSVAPGGNPGEYIDILSLPLDERQRLGPIMTFYGYDDDNSRLDGLTDTSIRCVGNCRSRYGYPPYIRLDKGHLAGLDEDGLSHGFWLSGADNSDAAFIQAYLGSFVFGTTSTLNDLSSLQTKLEGMNEFSELASSLVATYKGHTALGARVRLNINFSDNTWGGSFNRGRDGQVMAYASENGTSVIGHVGFDIEGGTISGINLNADSSALSARDGAVTGAVTASFFGEGASEIGGVADIVKTKSPIQSTAIPQGIDGGDQVKPKGYENAVHVTTFSTSLDLPKYEPNDT